MKFEIKNKWTGNVQFTAEIEASEETPFWSKVGLSVKWAIKNNADLRDADLRGADLRGADLRGADLSDADLRGAVLSGAVLRGAVLSGAVLRGAVLRGAVLSDADLRGADLRGADLRGADLRGAVLSGAVLRGAVLRGAVLSGADWIPRIKDIHQTVYRAASQDGALEMGSWHKHENFCGTTHCRAGWVTHLAGDGGRVLDAVYGTAAAAALIYQASDPSLDRIPDFYAGNETALEDMKLSAKREADAQGKDTK